MKLRILTFNWHAPYLSMLARLPHDFLVVEPEVSPGRLKHWEAAMRPRPGNVITLSPDAGAEALAAGRVDLAIAHNVKDLVWMHRWRGAKIVVFHNRLSTEIALGQNRVDRDDYLSRIGPFLEDARRVFISESKRADWGMEGDIILPGIDLDLFDGYTGERALGLRVGNHFRERNLMLGYDVSEKIAAGLPVKTLGINPTLPGSRPSRDFADLLEHYRCCRFYLHTTVSPHEDGYNLAMLEAMATGMPVVALENPTSPVVDGGNGYISGDLEYLRESARRLLADRGLALRLGAEARETVRRRFGQEAFLDAWSRTIERVAGEGSFAPAADTLAPEAATREEATPMAVLMDYVSYPATTARYLERALRKFCTVVTRGSAINDDTLRRWNLLPLKDRVTLQDLPSEPGEPLADTLANLPGGFQPGLYLWVETGLDGPPPDLEACPIPKACYLIDSHLNFARHQALARDFDWVFVAQKAFVEPLRAAGCERVFWLPLACDPETHAAPKARKTCDVGFAGTVSPAHRRRAHLLSQIGENFHLRAERRFLEDMATLYAESRIVFNNAIDGDLNMRVFEALASGSLLLTDRVPESGLEELLEPGRHFAFYEDENLLQTVRYYLDRTEERERIAAEGRRHVLAHHTYLHRARALIAAVRGDAVAPPEEEPREKQAAPASPPAKEAPARPGRPGAADASDAAVCGGEREPEAYYRNVRRDVIPLVPEDAAVVLEVGCGAGATGRELKKTRGRFVAGIEIDARAARAAREVLDEVLEGNIETMELPYRPGSFDCILLADVIEHLVDPLAALNRLRPLLKPGGTVVASIPNVQYFGLLHHLVEGNWTYQDEGILDRTHLRFFTFREIEKLFKSAGLVLTRIEENLNEQYAAVQGADSLRVGRLAVSGLTAEELRRFFVFQYLVAARLEAAPAAPAEQGEGFARPADLKDKKIADARRLEEEGMPGEAARVYGQIGRLFPDCAATRFLAARAHEKAGDRLRALELLEEKPGAWEGDLEAVLALGRLRLALGRADGALEAFFKGLNLAPEDSRIFLGLGRAHEAKDLPALACHCYLKALAFDGHCAEALNRVLDLLKSRPAGVLALIDRLLLERPGHAGLIQARTAYPAVETPPPVPASAPPAEPPPANKRTLGRVSLQLPLNAGST